MAKSKTKPEAEEPEVATAEAEPDAEAPEQPENAKPVPIPIPPGAEVTEVLFKGATITVTATFDGPNGPDSITVSSTRAPSVSFVQAKQALVPVLLKLVEIKPRVSNHVELLGVTFKRSSENARGAILKGKRGYAESAGVLALNSPIKYTGDPMPQRVMDSGDWLKCSTLADEALAYAKGHGDNLDLFSGDGAAGKPEAPAEPAEEWEDDGGEAMRKAGKKLKS